MKIITLNIWGGRVLGPLLEFTKARLQDIDIICLQEVYSSDKPPAGGVEYCTNTLQQMAALLPQHEHIYAPSVKGIFMDRHQDPGLGYGNAVFIRKQLKILEFKNEFIVKSEGDEFDLEAGVDHPRSLQIVALQNALGRQLIVANYHGYWSNGPKTDDEVRLSQSHKINELLSQYDAPTILCGDFNLLPTTKSLGMLQEGRVDLVAKYQLLTTRSKLYKRIEYAPFADYIFTTLEVRDKSFRALDEVVSDHLALELDFDLV
jgi:endonuclease/exonuclease/phosphatase family metal-dependent hydrolase